MEVNGQKKILIVGFSGAGKSTYLSKLKAQGAKGEDLDEIVLKLTGALSLRQYIKEHGESSFRELERQALKGWMEEARAGEYLALGGGSLSSQSLEWLNHREDWVAIYLKRSFSECWENLNKKGESLLIDLGQERAQELYAERAPLYEKLKYLMPEM